MIISRAEIQSAISAYRALKRKPGVATVAYDTDRFDRSADASSLAALAPTIAEPFYRPELVEELQRRISEGRYFVSSEEIVDKLLGRLIVQLAV